MKQFDIPEFYRSPIISRVKAKRKAEDPRKKDFTPTLLNFGKIEFLVARHFGFCYGVENAIEISYNSLLENPGKRIFLLSQMIHNPDVNADLVSNGIQFIQDTDGSQLIPWEELTSEDIVIIPAFGTTLEVEQILRSKGINTESYNTTCPFVEKVWNRSEKLGNDNHTIIIHGKYNHEETRATFSHANKNAPSIIIKDMNEAQLLAQIILGEIDKSIFEAHFKEKMSAGFDADIHFSKIGIVNQTTMLANETQEITDFLRNVMIKKYGEERLKEHIADTRDTLCYATNDNQTSTLGLMENQADLAIVVGGYNSSNTTHLVELLEQKFTTFFIRSANEIHGKDKIQTFDIHSKSISELPFLPEKETIRIALTSGASCPDAIVDGVIKKILDLLEIEKPIEEVI